MGRQNKGHASPNRVNLIGKRFGRLTVISLQKSKRSIVWECKCDCGNLIRTTTNALTKGYTKSCGCLQAEKASITAKRGIEENWFQLYKGTSISRIKSTKPRSDNTSGVRGVCWDKHNKKFVAYLTISGHRIRLGGFDNLEDAAYARKEAEEKYFQPLIEEYEKGDNQ